MGYKRDPILEKDKLKTLRISPSSINTFSQCPRKWFFDYIKARTSKQTIHLIRGNVVHKVLEDIFKTRYFPSGEAFRISMMKKSLSIFEGYWKEDFKDFEFDDDTQNKIFYDESKIMVERFITKFCDNIQHGISAKKYSNETQGYYFTRPLMKELWICDEKKIQFDGKWKRKFVKKEDLEDMEDTLHVGGFIDSVQKDFDNNLILVDYKTSTKYKNVFTEDYMRQLSIYSYLWYKQTGELPKYVCVNYLKYDESFYLLVTNDLIKYAINEIKNMRNNIIDFGLEKEKYFCKESKLCEWCSHQNDCISLKDTEVIDVK